MRESAPIEFSKNQYIVATFAIWAGDITYAQELLRQVVPTFVGAMPDKFNSPEQVVKYVAALKRRQISQRIAEAEKIAVESRGSLEPPIVETPHLRGTVWRLDPRTFRVNAYLKDLTWHERLLELAAPIIAKSRESTKQLSDDTVKRCGRWVVEGQPFIQVRLSPLGQIVMTATFTGAEPPTSYKDQIEPVILRALLSVDVEHGVNT